jgi:hypothetical protein
LEGEIEAIGEAAASGGGGLASASAIGAEGREGR